MTHPIDWPEIFASNPDANDVEIGRLLGCTRAHVGFHRNKLGIRVRYKPVPPARTPPPRPLPKRFTIGASCDSVTYDAVNVAARAEGTTASEWALQAIVERMERVQQRMAYLTVKEAVDEAATDYIGHP